MTNKFLPDYAVCPGETLREIMDIGNRSVEDIAVVSGLSTQHIEGILNGSIKITEDIARQLEIAVNVASETWLNLQRQYEETIRRLGRECPQCGGTVTVMGIPSDPSDPDLLQIRCDCCRWETIYAEF